MKNYRDWSTNEVSMNQSVQGLRKLSDRLRLTWLVFFLGTSLFLLGGNPVYAQNAFSVETVPNPKTYGGGYVTDTAGMIHSQDIDSLNAYLADIEKATGAQIAVVVLTSIGEENPRDFANRLFAHWGLGRKGVDDGLLLLIVQDQKRWEFETGYGLEGSLPDVVLKRIGEELLVPKMRENLPALGIYNSIMRIGQILEEDQKETDPAMRDYIRQRRVADANEVDWVFWAIAVAIYTVVAFSVAFLWIGHFALKMELGDSVDGRIQSITKGTRSFWFVLCFVLFSLPMLVSWLLVQAMKKDLKKDRTSCPECKQDALEKLPKVLAKDFLSPGQLKEIEMGNAGTDIWRCTNCQFQREVKRFLKPNSQLNCKQCGFETCARKYRDTSVYPTTERGGKEIWDYHCQFCGAQFERILDTPPRTSSSSDVSTSDSYSSTSDSSWSSDNSSSSSSTTSSSSDDDSSSWGGGQSGGGGAGGSW